MYSLDKKVNCVFLRLMLYIYRNQRCDVKWCREHSHRFPVSNGVRQGAVSSDILFAIYIDELLLILKNSGLGCHIDSVFLGVLILADDILLLSASRSVTLDGKIPPGVKKVTHLGCVLESDTLMKCDIALKRGKFIGFN